MITWDRLNMRGTDDPANVWVPKVHVFTGDNQDPPNKQVTNPIIAVWV